MDKIFDKAGIERHFLSDGDFYIKNVGYNDFSVIYPVKHPRIQNFYTLHNVISGKGFLFANGKKFRVRAGELFFLPPFVQIMYYPDDNDPWKYIWFAFEGEKAREYGKAMGFSVSSPVKETNRSKEIQLCAEKLFSCLQSCVGGYYMAMSCFYEIMQLCSDDTALGGADMAKKIIDENYSVSGFNISHLCEALAVSHSQLCKTFKNRYGISAVKYLIERRLELARRMLETTDLTVKTVAFSCGFNDDIHFMKTFKAHTGMSASEYRKKAIE